MLIITYQYRFVKRYKFLVIHLYSLPYHTNQIPRMTSKNSENVRLRLFRVKTFSGNYFTSLCVFGTKGKYGQPEILLHFDRKNPLLTRKTISILILPSNVLHFSHNPHTHSQTSHTRRSQPTPPSSSIHKHPRSTSPIASHAPTSIG